VAERPPTSGLEVGPPVDLTAEVGRPGAEEVEAVGEDSVRPLDHALVRSELEAGDRRHRGQDGSPQRRYRIDSSQRCLHLLRPGL
jgi:hypothetical protein